VPLRDVIVLSHWPHVAKQVRQQVAELVAELVFAIVTKVTFHLLPTATHLLGEWTLPSHALVLCSSEALHMIQ